VGAALASRIVAARPFAEVEDLRRVRGLRRATLERLRPFVTVADDAR
jgi:DNA uptake protein ComE-like DNA-binding protein